MTCPKRPKRPKCPKCPKCPKDALPFPEIPSYVIGKDGRVFNRTTGYELAPTEPDAAPGGNSKRCGRQVRLAAGGGWSKNFYVSHLVLLTHVGPPPSAEHVAAHLNGDEADDRLSNLAWLTFGELVARRAAGGRTARGWKNGRAQLREHEVVEIKRRLRNNESPGKIGEAFGVSARCVRLIRDGFNWAHVRVGGMQWPPQEVVDRAMRKKAEGVARAREKRNDRAASRSAENWRSVNRRGWQGA